jgi:hypothetical protein
MNNDLISRRELRKAFKKSPFFTEVSLYYARQLIDNAPTVESPQWVLRARDDAELEQLKEAWSKGTVNFAPIVAYTERMPIKCPDCKYFNKEWITDNRRKDKGYWNCWCSQHESWVGGEDGYCSLAERKEET